ncbi:MAG: putative membrane protein [Bacteroidia bacterium]|jgi:uncharacterized membrane protein
MVTSTRTASRLMIIARPNQSATWRDNVMLMCALAVPSLGAAIGFALAGAWPILPLAGLELTALCTALYWVCRKLQYRQVITVSDNSVEVDQGYSTPRQHYRFARPNTALSVMPQSHPWDGPQLSIYDRNGSVRLGEFLGRDDCLKLQALLEKEMAVRTQGKGATLNC